MLEPPAEERPEPPQASAEPAPIRVLPGGATERRKFEAPKRATSPSRRDESIALSPSSITVIPGLDVRDRFGVRFLSDAFRIIPGLEVMRTTSTESNVNVRGYNDLPSSAQGIIALIDGRQVYNEFLGNVLWESLPLSIEEVERIEVIRGPGSFLYGPNAMHGLVNIVTRSPLEYERDTFGLAGAYGSYHSGQATMMLVRRGESTGFRTSLGWDDIGEFDGNPPPNIGNKRFATFAFEKELDTDHRVALSGGLHEQNQELSIIQPVLPLPPATIANEMFESYVKGNYTFGDLKAQVSWTGTDAVLTPDRIYLPFELDLDVLDVDLQYSFELWEGHDITTGTGYRHATFDTKNQDISEGRHSTNLTWFFIQDELELIRNVFVIAGLRLDHHSVTGVNPSPRVAAVWKFDEAKDDGGRVLREQSLRASAGYGYRNPSLLELWYEAPLALPVGSIQGNLDLDAERIRSFEVGYLGRGLERLKGAVSIYYNLIDDLIEYQDNTPAPSSPENITDEEAYGVETELEVLFSESISAFANYSYGIRRDRDTFDRVKRTPLNKANAGIRVSTPWRLSGMLWATYFGTTEFKREKVPEYVLLNGQLTYTITLEPVESRVFVQAFNLFDHDHQEHPLTQRHGLILMAGFGLRW